MAVFNFDFSPADNVYVVIDKDTEDSSISIKKGKVLEDRVISYLDGESVLVNELLYLVFLTDDSLTEIVKPTNIFSTKEEAIDFIRNDFEITPTPTPSNTPTPSVTPSVSLSATTTPTPTPSISESETPTPTPTPSISESVTPTPTPSPSA